jgi:hypothetical protein
VLQACLDNLHQLERGQDLRACEPSDWARTRERSEGRREEGRERGREEER